MKCIATLALVALTAFSSVAHAGLGQMALVGGVAYASQHKDELKEKARIAKMKAVLAVNAAALQLKQQVARHHR